MKKTTLAIIVMGIISIISVSAAVMIYFHFNSTETQPEFAPIETDKNQKPMEEENPGDKLDHAEGGGSVNINFTDEVKIDSATGRATLTLENPYASSADMQLEVCIDNTTIAKSGLIEPGNKISTLNLLEGISLPKGKYNGTMKIGYYDSETNEKAGMATEIAVSIFVE